MKAAIVMHLEGDSERVRQVLANFRHQWERDRERNTPFQWVTDVELYRSGEERAAVAQMELFDEARA